MARPDPAPAAPAPARESPAPLLVTDTEHWLELIARSRLRGPAKQLAAHVAFVSHAEGVLRLSLAPEQEHLKSPSLVLQLGDAVASLLGGDVQLRLEVGAVRGETASVRQSRERSARQDEAERGFAGEPAIRRLVEQRGAQIVPDSIRPPDDN